MSVIYLGTGWSRTAVGECENGVIYKGTGWNRTPIGAYDHKYIYQSASSWSQTLIGEYENGIVYQGNGASRTQVGCYNQSIVYSATSGWSRTAVGEYTGSPVCAAVLLLFPELQNHSITATAQTVQKQRPAQETNPFGSMFPLWPILAIPAGIILVLTLVYHMYFTVQWGWANYAMFLTSLFSFIASNLILYRFYKKSTNISSFIKNLIPMGLFASAGIGTIVVFIIYLAEQIYLSSLNFGYFLLGFIIAPVDVVIYAVPFAIGELLVLLIIRYALNKSHL